MRIDCLIPLTAGIVVSTASGQSCPPVALPGCQGASTIVCQNSSTFSFDLDLSLALSVTPIGACSPVASYGGAGCGVGAGVATQGETSGICGSGQCSEFAGGGDGRGAGGDLLASPIDLLCHTGQDTYYADAEVTAAVGVTPQSLSGSLDVSVDTQATSVIHNFGHGLQTSSTEGSGGGGGGGGGGFATLYEGNCDGFVGTLDLDMFTTTQVTCSGFGTGCAACPTTGSSSAFTSVHIVWGTTGSGPGGEMVLQGLNSVRQMEDGTLEPIQMGLFADPQFEPNVLPDGSRVSVNGDKSVRFGIPAGATSVDVSHDLDSFNDHDGDIDGDAAVCNADAGLMNTLVGVSFGEPSYTPRADFDLDGDIDADDLAAFNAIFEHDTCACLAADITGDCCVAVDDLIQVVLGWGSCDKEGACPADVNRDGEVNVDDLISVILQWGLGDCM